MNVRRRRLAERLPLPPTPTVHPDAVSTRGVPPFCFRRVSPGSAPVPPGTFPLLIPPALVPPLPLPVQRRTVLPRCVAPDCALRQPPRRSRGPHRLHGQ